MMNFLGFSFRFLFEDKERVYRFAKDLGWHKEKNGIESQWEQVCNASLIYFRFRNFYFFRFTRHIVRDKVLGAKLSQWYCDHIFKAAI